MTGGDRRALADREARRRVVQLMLFRVALITFVLGTTALTAPTVPAVPTGVGATAWESVAAPATSGCVAAPE